MTVDECARARRTAHAYLPEPVPDIVVDRALATAHQAPCHKHSWPWRFIRVGPETQARLVELAVRTKEGDGPPNPALRRVVGEKFGNPGALVVATVVRDDDPVRAREDYAAACCAVQNLLLSVTAAGFASKWSTGGLTRLPDALALLGVETAVEDVVGFVWIGVPARIPEVQRPPLEAVVRHVP